MRCDVNTERYVLRAVDGREIAPLNERQLVDACKVIQERGIKNVSQPLGVDGFIKIS